MTTTTPAAKRGLRTVEDAAELFRMHPRTIRRWANDGRIGHVRFGKQILFTPQQLKDAIDAHSVAPREQVDVAAPNPLFEPDEPRVVPMLPRHARQA